MLIGASFPSPCRWSAQEEHAKAAMHAGLPILQVCRMRTMRLAVLLHEVAGHAVDLHGQLPCGGDDQNSCAIPRLELGAVQQLYGRYEKGKSLARACMKLNLSGHRVYVGHACACCIILIQQHLAGWPMLAYACCQLLAVR